MTKLDNDSFHAPQSDSINKNSIKEYNETKMAKVVEALSWSTGRKKREKMKQNKRKTTTTASGYEASS